MIQRIDRPSVKAVVSATIWLVMAGSSIMRGSSVIAGPADSRKVDANAIDRAQIIVKNFMFVPTSLTVKTGSTVTWANLDDEPHTVVGDAGLFRSGALDTHESFSFSFDKPGTYHFTCSIHPYMVGTIVVQ